MLTVPRADNALAVASKNLNTDHRPDFTNTEPAANIGPFPQWSDPKKIVAMDPLGTSSHSVIDWLRSIVGGTLQPNEVALRVCFDPMIAHRILLTRRTDCMILLAGHLSPWLFKDIIQNEDVDIRPTIAITKAHMKVPELEDSVKAGRLVPDGKICLNASGELAVTKFAVEPVWYLPGVAERFEIDEATLRRSLFEHTGGSYPELITRGDIKTFLPYEPSPRRLNSDDER